MPLAARSNQPSIMAASGVAAQGSARGGLQFSCPLRGEGGCAIRAASLCVEGQRGCLFTSAPRLRMTLLDTRRAGERGPSRGSESGLSRGRWWDRFPASLRVMNLWRSSARGPVKAGRCALEGIARATAAKAKRRRGSTRRTSWVPHKGPVRTEGTGREGGVCDAAAGAFSFLGARRSEG